MVRGASPDARPGDLVAVFDKHGERFGSAFYNPRSRITLRMVAFGDRPADDAYFEGLIKSAVHLRREVLRLDEATNAYRVVHAEGDGLSGLVVDRFDDVLSVEVFSYAVHRRLGGWLPALHALCGTRREVVQVDAAARVHEGLPTEAAGGEPAVRSVQVVEHGVRFAVGFDAGHKTGFFCDQRENRRLFSELVRGRSVLDVCAYTGGFALHAAVNGGAREVVGVDLDEQAVDQARHNANLNQARVRFVHADAFVYMRQMIENGNRWQAVVLDPPKLIARRDDFEEGRRRYFDLNRLALQLVEPGGVFLSASCSGLLGREEFEGIVAGAARHAGRRLQILRSTGAGPDHPAMSGCPESLYLKALWARVL
jgi:23S rRNA (cytosine1962-C5)-methyltransferase